MSQHSPRVPYRNICSINNEQNICASQGPTGCSWAAQPAAEHPSPARKRGGGVGGVTLKKVFVRRRCKAAFKTVFCSECGLTVQGERSKENHLEEGGGKDARGGPGGFHTNLRSGTGQGSGSLLPHSTAQRATNRKGCLRPQRCSRGSLAGSQVSGEVG